MTKITGSIMSNRTFQFKECNEFKINYLLEVFQGKLAGCIFRDIISPGECRKIAKNFWNNLYLRQRNDGVPGSFLGTYHYKKSLENYFKEAELFNPILSSIFKNTTNYFQVVIDELKNILSVCNQDVRPARYINNDACYFFMRSWPGNKGEKYALAPHDDSAQCSDKNQEGFEIQTTINSPIVAANFCIENNEGGNLQYWNVQPDLITQKILNLEGIGYPYPDILLNDFEMINVNINAGDIYFFNGKNIHAVSSPIEKESFRTTISCLMGKNSNNDIIYWT